MSRWIWTLFSGLSVSGCKSTPATSDSAEPSPSTASPLVRDLVRVHQEVFDQLVLFTISSGDCEYPFPDSYGPEDFEFQQGTWPYPDIMGTLSLSVEMIPVENEDLWTIQASYAEVSAGSGLSDGERPVLDGSGSWTVQVPGRDHTLSLMLAVDGAESTAIELEFGISDYISGGYIFGVDGSIGGQEVETSVEAENPCPGDSR